MVNDSTAMDLARDVCVRRSNEQISDREACALIAGIVEDSGRRFAGGPGAVAAPAIVLPAELLPIGLRVRAEPAGPQVSLGGEDEVCYWTQRFGVTGGKLRRAVSAVGHGVERIEDWLRLH